MTMNADSVIFVENLGKKYTLQHQPREQYTALRDVITNGFASFGNRLIHPFSSTAQYNSPIVEDFWALQDVSFEVKQGDRIGIIGRNGAGKSTLLKILSRITEPTTGSIRIKGRVASLLEVGTGFHPELSGRENIFLNGAILGMQREEIRRKLDEIIDFAEIEKFLDTPVKRYSSGMYVRLAFAVAAHLEPEILIVDEVLAVGDAPFQKKCLGKMEDVGREGRTVLFVSHNMAAVNKLCSKGILLEKGSLGEIGSVNEVVQRYLDSFVDKPMEVVFSEKGGEASFSRVSIVSTKGSLISGVSVCNPFLISMDFIVSVPIRDVDISVRIRTIRGNSVCMASLSDMQEGQLTNMQSGVFSCSFLVPAYFLVPDVYRISVELHLPCVRSIDYREDVVEFVVNETGSTMQRYQDAWIYGSVLPHFRSELIKH